MAWNFPLAVAMLSQYNLDAAGHPHSGIFVDTPELGTTYLPASAPSRLLGPRSMCRKVSGSWFRKTRHVQLGREAMGGLCLGAEEPLPL